MIKPLGNNILLTADKTPDEVGGLIVPESIQKQNLTYTVVATGTDKSLTIKKGMRVIIPKHGGTIITADGVEYRSIPEPDILGIIKD
jgi:co-chaperonin GroES (HSP10)